MYRITVVVTMACLLSLVPILLAIVSCGLLAPLALLVFVPMTLQVIFSIIAALAVRDGSHYRYPFNFRLLQ